MKVFPALLLLAFTTTLYVKERQWDIRFAAAGGTQPYLQDLQTWGMVIKEPHSSAFQDSFNMFSLPVSVPPIIAGKKCKGKKVSQPVFDCLVITSQEVSR